MPSYKASFKMILSAPPVYIGFATDRPTCVTGSIPELEEFNRCQGTALYDRILKWWFTAMAGNISKLWAQYPYRLPVTYR